MAKPKKEFSMKFRRDFIGEHVKVSPEDYKNPRFWGREIKITGQLYEEFNDIRFLKNFKLGFKLNSLAWLMSGEGRQEIKKKWAEFNYVPTKKDEEVVLTGIKAKDNVYISKKKQTLLDFINS